MKYYTIYGAKIDNYIIPMEDVADYLKRRNYWRQKLITFFTPHFHEVTTGFKGSQDGEAVIAFNEKNELELVFHLDPYYLKQLDTAKKNNRLEQYLNNHLRR